MSTSAATLRALLAWNARQVFGFGLGWPVLPEVKPIATICSAAISAVAAACASGTRRETWSSGGSCTKRSGIGASAASLSG
jgi:hypothetical protein